MKSSTNLNRIGRAALLAGVLASALLASCGGGEQVQTFVPTRVIAFGDESSVIRPDGSVESVELNRSSGLKILDAAAHRIVQMAAPFAAFPTDIRKDTDLLVITRTWFFAQGDKVWTE